MPLVRHVAGRLIVSAQPYLELGDLVAIGVEALLRAWIRYDESRGVPFATFAYPRVRGAMWESIGTVGPFSRGIMRRRPGRPDPRLPDPWLCVDELYLDPAVARMTAADQITLAIDAGRLGPNLQGAVDSLEERDREIIVRHYFGGDSLLEIGRDMGRSRSWASRAHSSALARLRAALEPVPSCAAVAPSS